MKSIFLFLFLLLATTSFAQQRFVDSLLKAYTICKTDTARIDILLSVAVFYRDAKPEKTIDYGKMALGIAQQINNKKREARLLVVIGQGYERIGDIANAISNYNESFLLAKNDADLKALAEIKLCLGTCYSDLGNFQWAIEYSKGSEEYFAMLNDIKGLCKSEIYTSDALYKSGNGSEALYHLERARRLSLKLDNYGAVYIYTNMAEAYVLQKKYDLAKDYALKAMDISEKLNNLYAMSEDYVVLAKIYLALNEVTPAEINVKKGLEIARQTNIRENLIEGYNIYSKVLEKQARFSEALKFQLLYMATNDSDRSARNNNMVQIFENERRDHYIEQMKAEEKEKDSDLKRQELVIIIIFLILILTIGLSGYIFYSRNKLRAAHLEIERAYHEVNSKQNEIIEQAQSIQELSHFKDRLFTIISHDLRSPLQTLKGMLNLLVSERLSQDQFQQTVPKLVQGVSSTLNLVENLLHWSGSQLKGTSLAQHHFDIHSLAQNQMNLFEKQAADKQIELRNEIPENTTVFADKNMIDLVLRNLVANAIKFCNMNNRIVISARQLDKEVEISVSDNGIGIAPKNLHKIFQTKERFTTRGTNNEVGSGVGLMLCKDFVEKNNGIIGVESKVNEGTRFWFTLPA